MQLIKHTFKIAVYLSAGVVLFIGGGFFFIQFTKPTTDNSVVKIAENNFRKIGDSQEIITEQRELLAPLPLRSFDSEKKTEDSSFSGDYGLLDIKGVILFTNIERGKNGFSNLIENRELNNSAEKKVDDIIAHQYFEHKSPDGLDVSDLSTKAGYDYILIGENLAMGDFKNNQDLVDAWMASPGHRANILKSKYSEIGVSAKRGVYQGREVWVAVQHFGLGSEVCPQINYALKYQVTSEKSRLEAIAIKINALKVSPNDYNNAIEVYNADIAKLKNKITKYNSEVINFNDCIAGYEPGVQIHGSF